MKRAAGFLICLLLLASCRERRYYASVSNPYSLGLKISAERHEFYNNIKNEGTVAFYLVNYSGEAFNVPKDPGQAFRIAGYPRFSNTARYYRAGNPDWKSAGTSIPPGDSVLILVVTAGKLLGAGSAWFREPGFKKPALSPLYSSAKQNFPYGRIQLQMKAGERWIISPEVKIVTGKYVENTAVSRKAELTISVSGQEKYHADGQNNGMLECKVKNTGEYNIELFSNPGSTRFNLYGYSPNRTSVMKLEFRLSGSRLPFPPKTIKPGESVSVFQAALDDLLYIATTDQPWYWTWNKKFPPVSPLVYKNGKPSSEVEFWFGIIVDGKEILSNPVMLPVLYARK